MTAVITVARTYTDISRKVTQILREVTIDDAWGFRMRFGRFDALVWMFPTDGYGLIYDAATGNWSEWREGGVAEGPVTITSAYNWTEEGVFLVGLSDGSIAKLDDESTVDWFDDNGNGTPIKIAVTSGFTNHGSGAQKHCRTAMFMFRRTQAALPANNVGSLSTSGHVRISYRDDQGTWNVLRDIELSAEREIVVPIRSVGVYRTRQWKVEYTGADEIQFVGAQEEFEPLGA